MRRRSGSSSGLRVRESLEGFWDVSRKGEV